MASKTSRYTSAWISLLLLLMVANPLMASRSPLPTSPWGDELPSSNVAGDTIVVSVDSILSSTESDLLPPGRGRKKAQTIHFINGFGVGADLIGVGMKLAGSDWSQMEVLARVNILERYFPVFELGLGEADHEGRDLDNRFSVRSPYFRIGADYNFRYRHADGNRFFAGLRYGFSAYTYDLDSPVPLSDPVWGTEQPFHLHGLSGNAHWAEVVLGVETRLWSIVRLGWDMRFKLLIHQKANEVGDPWYIPGLGKQPDGIGWGGTVRLMFDI